MLHLAPTVMGGDQGDFASAIAVHGVPHPSGFPLYMLLGILMSFIPLPIALYTKVAFLSTLLSAGTVTIFYTIVTKLTNNKNISLIASLSLAFFPQFAFYAEVVEVFALHNFLVMLLIWITFCTKKNDLKTFFFFSFIVGLSLTNNLSIILFLPVICLFFLQRNSNLLIKRKKLFLGIIFFLLGLTPYLYLPVAAFFHPAVNWGNPSTFAGFSNVVLRKVYGWGITEAPPNSTIIPGLLIYFSYLRIHLTLFILGLCLIGMYHLATLKEKRSFFFFILILFILVGPFYVGYSRIPDASLGFLSVIERFYINSTLFLFFFYAFGLLFIHEKLNNLIKLLTQNKDRNYSILVISVLYIIPLSLMIKNNTLTNFQKLTIGENYARDLLEPLPKNSLIKFYSDSAALNTLYLQQVLNVRKDVFLPGGYRGENYFYSSRKSIRDLEDRLRKSKKYNLDDLALILATKASQNIFYENIPSHLTSKELRESYFFVPYGLVFQILPKDRLPDKEEFFNQQKAIFSRFHIEEFQKFEPIISDNLVINSIVIQYRDAANRVGQYLTIAYGDEKEARYFYALRDEINQLF